MKRILVVPLFITLLFLSACGKHPVCLELGENANVHGDFGYFYDSATIDINGPAKFQRFNNDTTGNPCSAVSPQIP